MENMSGVQGSLLRPFLMAHFFPVSRFISRPPEAGDGMQRFLEKVEEIMAVLKGRLMKKMTFSITDASLYIE